MSRHSPLIFLVLLSTAGCESSSRSPSAPLARIAAPSSATQATAHGSPWRYPLILGATWTYEGSDRTRDRLDGQAEFGPWNERRFTRVARAVRHTDFPGIEYLVIESALMFEGVNPGPFQSVQYLRQDDAALYSYPNLGGLTSSVAGGVPAPRRMETVLLVYPVHVGSVWSASGANGSTFTVEAIEAIRTPRGVEPAARVRASSGGRPELTWLGRSGELRTWNRGEQSFTTPYGQHGVRERITEQHLVAVTGL
jgi:hypothetical protein